MPPEETFTPTDFIRDIVARHVLEKDSMFFEG